MNHLIITAHGIRTYGDWQERLETLTKNARPEDPPEHMVLKYGFFSFLQYVFPPLRWVKVSLFCRELQHKLQSKNWDRIDMVGHSFGTYIIAYGLLKLAQDKNLKFKVNTVILAGSVLKDNFPWQPLLNTHLTRLVNYCGTKDNVLLLNQLFVLFAGVAGRFGFSGGLGNNFRNRMFPFGHSGYFEPHSKLGYEDRDDFMRAQWQPLLLGDGPIAPTVPLVPSVTDGIRDFVFRNMEPIKLAVWLAPVVAVFLMLWSAKRSADESARLAIASEARAYDGIAEASRKAWGSAREYRGKQDIITSFAYLAEAVRYDRLLPESRQTQALHDDVALSVLRSNLSPIPLGQPLRPDQPVQDAHFSPDSRRVISISADGTVQQWDTATGKPVGNSMRCKRGVSAKSFSPDGQHFVTINSDNTAQQWDTSTGKPIGKILRYMKGGRRESLSANGKRIDVGGDKSAMQRDTTPSKLIDEPLIMPVVRSASFSPDGRGIILVSGEKEVQLWSAATGELLGEPLRHRAPVLDVNFSPDYQRIVTACWDNTARLWEISTGTEVGKPLLHDHIVWKANFSPDGQRIVTACLDNTVRIWDAVAGSSVGQPMRHDDKITSASFSPDGQRIVTASQDRTVRLWDSTTGSPMGEPLRHVGEISCASFSPDGQRIVTIARDNTVRLWDAAIGPPMGELLRHEGHAWRAKFSNRGQRVITISGDQTYRFWEVGTGKPLGGASLEDMGNISEESPPDLHTSLHWVEILDVAPAHTIANEPDVRSFVGRFISEGGEIKDLSQDERIEWHQRLLGNTASIPWQQLLRWKLSNPRTRTISYRSNTTTPEHIEREVTWAISHLAWFKEKSSSSIQKLERINLSVLLTLDPGAPLVHLGLAAIDEKPVSRKFLVDYGLKRLTDTERTIGSKAAHQKYPGTYCAKGAVILWLMNEKPLAKDQFTRLLTNHDPHRETWAKPEWVNQLWDFEWPQVFRNALIEMGK